MRLLARTLLIVGTMGTVGEAKQTPMDPDALRQKAQTTLNAGDWKNGIPMLLGLLDKDPTDTKTLDLLGVTYQTWPEVGVDELFRRLDAAVAHASDPAAIKRLRWWRLTYAVFFDRMDLVKRIAEKPDDVILGDPQRTAALGSLLVELGHSDEGQRLLARGDVPLAHYHIARLAAAHGDTATARKAIEAVQGDAGATMLKRAGLAVVDLDSGAGTKAAKGVLDDYSKIEFDGTLPPLVVSELKLLRIRVALAEKRSKDATSDAHRMGLPPYRADPSAMMRAAKLVGPLWKAPL